MTYTVDDFEPGISVIYHPHPDAVPEEGVVVRTNDTYVFVRYGLNAVAATRPADLTPLRPRREAGQ